MRIATLVAVLVSVANMSVVRAQSPAPIELSFVRSFIGTCLRDFPDIGRVRHAAKALKWLEMRDPNLRGMLGPADPKAQWEGWLMRVDGHAFLVGISEGLDGGRTVKSCSLAADRIKSSIRQQHVGAPCFAKKAA